jgi:hypothetical protein
MLVAASKLARRRIEAGPSNCGPAFRIGPTARDTWGARPVCVPPPTGEPDSSFHRWHRAVPPRCDGYAGYTDTRRRFHGRLDCHSPFRQRCWGCSAVGRGRSTTIASRVGANSLVSWTWAPAMVAPSGPPVASTTRLRFTPFSHGLSGCGPPGCRPSEALPMAVEHPPQVDPPMPFGLGRIMCVQNPLNHGQHVVWHVPDGRSRYVVALWFSHGNPPLGEEGYW